MTLRGAVLATFASFFLCLTSVWAQNPPSPTAPAITGTPSTEEGTVGRTVAELDALLGRLTDGSAEARREAAQSVVDSIEREDVPAVRQRLLAPLRAEPEPMRFKMIRAIRTVTDARPNAEYDLLTLLCAQPRSRDLDIAIERITLARGLGRIPTADAGRGLLALAGAFNGVFRQEVGRIVRAQTRDYILPAMIELRSPSENMRVFLRQVREALRRVTPGETVQQHDNALLAEILRAFGSIRQQDAMKVVVSFANSDRAQVRDAARWAVNQYGREALNALREAYEMYEGHPPTAGWGWERVARELYSANDRRRALEVQRAFEEGLAAGREGRHDVMLQRFRYVLSRHPSFERRGEMVPALEATARALEGTDAVRAQAVYRLALWVDPEGPRAGAMRSAVLFLDAERALARGVAEPELYRAALRADGSNARAQGQLDRVEQVAVLRARRVRRLFGALALLGLALGALWVVLRRPEGRRWVGLDSTPPATASPAPTVASSEPV
ncbi:MAG: hypothetical protein HY909_27475 [Deltaproteobacteria bacterium]|nr:hypothetical protein [Deltaproteobacteria bacterium]